MLFGVVNQCTRRRRSGCSGHPPGRNRGGHHQQNRVEKSNFKSFGGDEGSGSIGKYRDEVGGSTVDAPRRRQVETSFRRGQKRSKKGLLWALTLTICRREYRRQNGLEISNFESFKRAAASWGVGECSEEVGGDQACPRTQGERLSEGVPPGGARSKSRF